MPPRALAPRQCLAPVHLKVAAMKLSATYFATLALASACGLAHAQADFYRRAIAPNVTEGGTVGAAVLVGPRYSGSDETRVRMLPSIDYQW